MKRVRCILVALVLHLAENAMESSSVSECEEVFLWLEANLRAFRTPRMVYSMPQYFTLLRALFPF